MTEATLRLVTDEDFAEPPDDPAQITCPYCEGEVWIVWSDGTLECLECEAESDIP